MEIINLGDLLRKYEVLHRFSYVQLDVDGGEFESICEGIEEGALRHGQPNTTKHFIYFDAENNGISILPWNYSSFKSFQSHIEKEADSKLIFWQITDKHVLAFPSHPKKEHSNHGIGIKIQSKIEFFESFIYVLKKGTNLSNFETKAEPIPINEIASALKLFVLKKKLNHVAIFPPT